MPWDLAEALETSLDVSAQDAGPTSVTFSADGSRMFLVGTVGDDAYQYDLCAPWAITTAVYDTAYALSGNPHALAWKPDGLRFWTIDTGSGLIRAHTCSTAWDLSTATADGVTFSLAAQDGFPLGLSWRPDGSAFYTCGNGNNNVYQYACSTPWDVSTASFVASFSVAAQDGEPQDVWVRDDGAKLYLAGSANDRIYRYSFGTAWDVTTLSYDGVSVDLSAIEQGVAGFFYRSDGSLFYAAGNQLGVGVGMVHQFGHVSDNCDTFAWLLGASTFLGTR